VGTNAPVRRVTQEPRRESNPFIRRMPTTTPRPETPTLPQSPEIPTPAIEPVRAPELPV
jgi:hypothetical protein